MARQIFVNLPIRDMERSRAFFGALGFSFNPQFSNEQGACMVVSDTIYVMLLTRDRFADFTAGPVGDPQAGTTVINCLSATSRTEVDELVARALGGGGRPWLDKITDGPMYGHSFADPDGHVWELLHMSVPA